LGIAFLGEHGNTLSISFASFLKKFLCLYGPQRRLPEKALLRPLPQSKAGLGRDWGGVKWRHLIAFVLRQKQKQRAFPLIQDKSEKL